nr:hypothetical protein [Tanacetum cinerariifolium]
MLAMITIVHLKFCLSIRNRVTIKTLTSHKIFMIVNNNIFVVKITRLLMKPTNEEEKQIEEEHAAKTQYWKILACYDDDDDYAIVITTKEPDNSLSMGDEHLDTIPATESDEFMKSSVENLVPKPSESEGEYEYISKKIYSNPLFDEEIISMKIEPHHFNAESDLIESLRNHDSLIISSSSKIDSLFDEFAGELTLLKSIPSGINDFDPEEETRFIKRLLYDNSSPQEIDLSFTLDDPMPSGIEEDDYDSERDILIFEELLRNDSLSLLENESFHLDIPSSSRPPAKPPDEDFSDNSINEVSAADSPVPAVGKISTNNTNTFSAAGPSNTVVRPTHGKSSYVDTSQYPDDPNMPELEDITYSDKEDVGAEADFTNLETTITVSPIPTTRFHKDHPVTQIIGDLSSATQTRSMTRVAKDQGGLSQINNDDFYTCGKSASTPIDTKKPLLKDPDGEDVDVHTYRSIIGSLMYLTSSRPDIMFAVNDVARLQALVDKKKVIITEATIQYALRLNDPKSIDCLPNEEIFTDLSRMGYEKPSTKLTFYKAFFLPQWKFLIHTILQCLSVKRTSWNKFSSSMASAVICLSRGRKFNFSKYIFDSLVRNVDSYTKFYMYPHFLQLMISAQVGDLSSHSTKYSSPALTQKVGKGFSRVDTPLFEGMIVAQQDDDIADEGTASVAVDDVSAAVDEPFIPSPPPTTQPPPPLQDLPFTSQVQPTLPPSLIAQPPSPQQQPQPPKSSHDAKILMDRLHTLLETCTTLTRRVEHLEQDKIAQSLEITKLKQRVKKLERRNKLKISKLRRLKRVGTVQRVDTSEDTVIDDISKQGRIIASMDADEEVTLKDVVDIAKEVALNSEIKETELKEVVEVVTTAKLMTEVVTTASAIITAADTPITAATLIAALSAARRRKEVVIRDPVETNTPFIIIHSEAKSKDKRKRILVEEPKPFKKQDQSEQDKAYARELEVELNKIINWDGVIDQVQRKEKEDNVVMRYQALKRKPQTEAQARKNMMIYLRNMAGFKMEYFKGMKYDDIRLIFEKYFNSNVAFLEKTKDQLEEEESRALKIKTESQEEKAAKKQKLDEEVEELKRHLQIVPNDEDDVYTEAIPFARKVPFVDYEIYTKNNKPYYKIIRADGSPQLFLSFLSLLRNFDREDLEVLWQLVKKRFASSKPKNFSDDFMLTTVTYMFKKPDVQAQVWKNQRIVHGLAKVKSWRLLESCGV